MCAERGLPLVCVQPLVSHIGRQQQDYTSHKTDEADCVMIARLAAELHCYIPEELDEVRADLLHLGRRRTALITGETASVQRIRDFLSVAWPVVTEACAQPFESKTWLAAMEVVTSRCGGRPGELAAMGLEAFTGLIRSAVAGWGGQRTYGPVCRAMFAALTSTEGVVWSHRRGLLRRVAAELGDLRRARAQRQEAEAAMVAALADLGLARLGDIPGLTATGAAVILAETGDPNRYDSSSSLVKHAGMSPSDNASGAFDGEAHISRRGRPSLRLTAWRAVWPMLIHNPVMAAKYQAMTAAVSQAGEGAQASGRPGHAHRASQIPSSGCSQGHEVLHLPHSVRHQEARDEDVGVGELELLRAPAVAVGRDPEHAPAVGVEDRHEDARRVKPRAAVPVDRPVGADQRDGVQVAGQAVFGDGQVAGHQRASWPAYGTSTSFPVPAVLSSSSCAWRASDNGRRSATTGWISPRRSISTSTRKSSWNHSG